MPKSEADIVFKRTLRFDNLDGTHILSERDLLSRPEPIVLLGEAGSGKTTLLKSLSDDSRTKFITARKLIRASNPAEILGDATILLIDAVDEVGAREDGDVVDSMLHQLELAGHPKFILSCRIADWRSATSVAGIHEDYERAPLEVRLEDLSSEEILEFLTIKFGRERAFKTILELDKFGMGEMFGNPQNLILLETVLRSGQLPSSTTELFTKAVELMWSEHSDAKLETALAKIGRENVLDALGSVYAAIILGGKDAVSKLPQHKIEENDLSMSSLSSLPAAGQISKLSGSRLIRWLNNDRFTYIHRRIGEFLAAKWLAKSANTPSKKRRLLALLKSGGMVPASLRGLHAWLGLDSSLLREVIAADPMGFIEYGDASNLDAEQARLLFDALGSLATTNPRFRRWGEYQAASLVQAKLLDKAINVVKNKDENFAWRTLILQQFENAPTTVDVATDLTELMMDSTDNFGVRYLAAVSLLNAKVDIDWPATIEAMRREATHDGSRLALDILSRAGFEKFSDVQIVELMFAHVGLSVCTVPRSDDEAVYGSVYLLQKRLPDNRIHDILGVIADYADALLPEYSSPDYSEILDTAYYFIMRRLKLGSVEPLDLWRWVQPFEEQRYFSRDSKQSLSQWLQQNHETRRAIQKIALLEETKESQIQMRAFRMHDKLPGLAVSEEDAIYLLAHLDPNNTTDDRWQEILHLIRHDKEHGAKLRKAAKRFATARPKMLKYIDDLATPKKPDWEIKQERKNLERHVSRQLAWSEHRASFYKVRDKIRAGEFGNVFPLAQSYLKMFNDSGESLPPHQRIAEWVGEEIQSDAFIGFEAFFLKMPAEPTALEISQSAAENRRWNTGPIIIAAAAERVRNNKGFSDVVSERLIAVRLELENTAISTHAGIDGLLEAIDAELRSRPGAWEELLRISIEPQLIKNRDRVYGLYGILRNEADKELTANLAIEWLKRFPDMAHDPEQELIDVAIDAGKFRELRQLSKIRTTQSTVMGSRLTNWKIVHFLTDYETAAPDLVGISEIDPEFLWAVRSRISGSRGERPRVGLTVNQLHWLIQEFRSHYPSKSRPSGVTTGDSNPWDAADYIHGLIGRLGQDPSDEALDAIAALSQIEDDYTYYIKSVAAEQKSIRSDRDFHTPNIEDIAAALSDSMPTSMPDLKSVVLEELDIVQSKVLSDEIESWRGFFNDAGEPNNEDKCRDYLIGILRQGHRGVNYNPEGHLASDVEVDIACEVGMLRLPIEVKGQWNSKLWSAADYQLARFYSADWRAEKQGIYLILWFGTNVPNSKKLKGRKNIEKPKSPESLKQAIVSQSTAASAGLIEVVVLDLSSRLSSD